MLNFATTLGVLLAVEPPTSPSDAGSAERAPEAAPVVMVEDMPDPFAPDWDPPEGPRRPPPTPPPPNMVSSAELPPGSSSSSNSSESAEHGKRLQLAGAVIGGSGVIGLLVGLYLYDDVKKIQGELAVEENLVAAGAGSTGRVRSFQDELDRKRQAMVISLAAGGSAVGLGSVLLVVGGVVKQHTASPGVTRLAPGPGLVGLSIQGRF